MNPDEPDYFCARCYALLRVGNPEESFCDNCDASIDSRADYLTRKEWLAKKVEDDRRWSEAEQSGLIQPRRSGEAGE